MNITKLPHYHVTAAFIKNENKFLITQRMAKDKFGGLWEFPGGKQKTDETLEECLIREISEELNGQIFIKRYLFSINHNYKEVKITLHVFHCQLEDGVLECKEVQNWKWVDFSNVKNHVFTAADEEIIRRLREYFYEVEEHS